MTGVAPRAKRRTREGGAWISFAAVAAFVFLWELLARLGVLPNVLFSSPTVIATTLLRSIRSGEMLSHAVATLWRTGAGLALGAIPGLLFGFAMGWSATLRRALDPLLAAIHPIPKIAILPLVMIFLGVGESARIAVASVAAFFPLLINAMAGVRQINPLYFEVAETYGATPLKLFTHVVIPGSLPLVLSGMRLAANVTLLVTIAAEIVMAERGLGSLVWLAWETLRVELLYATLIVIALLGVALTGSLSVLRRRLVPWQIDGLNTR